MSRMQEQRYEIKYLIDERTATRVRAYVQQCLLLDPFGADQPGLSYPVHSLHLDSVGLEPHWNTINGDKNRFKFRLRYYDDQPGSPAFFEIKRRMNNVINKERGGIRKQFVRTLLAGQLAERHHLLSPSSDTDLVATQHFQELMLRLDARPAMHVAFRREAYEKEGDNSVRVTMDRSVLTAPNHVASLKVRSMVTCDVFGATVVLELKFTDRFPNWFNDLVQTFDCVWTGAAKYAGGIELTGTRWARLPMPDWI